jgi:hypothetical protein
VHEINSRECSKHTVGSAQNIQSFIKEEYTNKKEVNKETNKEEVNPSLSGAGFKKLVLNSDLVNSWISETGAKVSESLGLLLNEYFIKKNTKKDISLKKQELQNFLKIAQNKEIPDAALVSYMHTALVGKSGKAWVCLAWYEETITKILKGLQPTTQAENISNSLLDNPNAMQIFSTFATAFTWDIPTNSNDTEKEVRLRNCLSGKGMMQHEETRAKEFFNMLPVGTDLAKLVGILTNLMKHLGVEYQIIKQNVEGQKMYNKPRTDYTASTARAGFFAKWVTGGQYVKNENRAPIWKNEPSTNAYYFPPSLKSFFLELRKTHKGLNDAIFAEFWAVVFPAAAAPKTKPSIPQSSPVASQQKIQPAPYKTFTPNAAPVKDAAYQYESILLELAENETFEELIQTAGANIWAASKSFIAKTYPQTNNFQEDGWAEFYAQLSKLLPQFSNYKN